MTPMMEVGKMEKKREKMEVGTWDEVAQALASTWERLREEGTPAWPEVADEVRASCVDAGLVKH